VLIGAVRLTGGVAHGVAYNIAKLIVLMTVVVVISLLLYAYYEAPMRRWLRQRWGRRPAPTFVDAASAS
jgi:peptidoglycan/LPS O-acetylase OafA/YrhL